MANKKSFLLRLEETKLNELRSLAEVREVTMSDLIRNILEDALGENDVKVEIRRKEEKKKWWL